jgi:ferredoxin
MDIPLMIRQIAAGEFSAALKTVKGDIALPAVLGRVCSAPCEKACRRSYHDESVSICKLKRFVADVDLESETPWRPERAEPTGKRVVVVGAGPMGLAASWHLALLGHEVTIIDEHEELGGGLRYGMPTGMLDMGVLESEVAVILSLGIETRLSTRLGKDVQLKDLCDGYDAVIVAFQVASNDDAESLGLPVSARGVDADKVSYATTVHGLFCRPGLVTKSTMSIRAVAAGKGAAQSVDAWLTGKSSSRKAFNSVFGKPKSEETALFMSGISQSSRQQVEDGYASEGAIVESKRCMHCDCRGKDECTLRDLATTFGSKQKRFPAGEREDFETAEPLKEIVYESGKCIRCGICVRICEEHGLTEGFTFLQRGYDVRVGTPFGKAISEDHRDIVLRCVDECPTGALERSTLRS